MFKPDRSHGTALRRTVQLCGQSSQQTFNGVIVSAGRDVDGIATAAPDKTIRYSGAGIEEKF